VADLRVTQVVKGSKGIHVMLKKISVGGALKRLSKHGSKRRPFRSFASQAIDF